MSQQQQQCITEQPQLTGYAEQLDDEQNEKRKKNNDSGPLNCFCGDCGCADCCDNNCLPTDCMECLGHIFCCCSLASNTNSGCDCGNVDCGGGGGDICCCP